MTLGADGVVMGSRFWASRESLAPGGAKQLAVATSGDGTTRSRVFDILRQKSWPEGYDFRAIRNDLHRKLDDDIGALVADPAAAIADYQAGVAAGDFSRAHATVGEATGMIRSVASVADIAAQLGKELQEAVARLA